MEKLRLITLVVVLSFFFPAIPFSQASSSRAKQGAWVDTITAFISGGDKKKQSLLEDNRALKTAILFEQMDSHKIARLLCTNKTNIDIALFILRVMNSDKASQIMDSDNMDIDTAIAIFGTLDPGSSAEILSNDNMSKAKAVNILKRLDSNRVARIINLDNMWADRAADILGAMDYEKTAEIFNQQECFNFPCGITRFQYIISRQKVREILSFMSQEEAIKIIASITSGMPMEYSRAAKVFQIGIGARRAASILEGVDIDEAARFLIRGNMRKNTTVAIIKVMDSNKAAQIIESKNIDTEAAAEILGRIDSKKLAEIFSIVDRGDSLFFGLLTKAELSYSVSAVKAGRILSLMNEAKVAYVLSYIAEGIPVYDSSRIKVLRMGSFQRAAYILSFIEPDKAVQILTSGNMDKGIVISLLKMMDIDKTARIVGSSNMDIEIAAGIIREVEPQRASKILNEVNINKSLAIIKNMLENEEVEQIAEIMEIADHSRE